MSGIFDIFSIEKWNALRIEDLYHPIFQLFIRIFMDLTFAISVFLYGFTVYIVITKTPKSLDSFKYTVFIQISCNFIYKTALFFSNPIFFFPLPILSVNSYFDLSLEWIIFGIAIVYLAVLTGAIAILFSVLNRTVAVYEPTIAINKEWIKLIFLPSKMRFHLSILAFMAAVGIIGLPGLVPFLLIRPYVEISLPSMTKDVPVIATIHRIFPNTFGLNPKFVGIPVLISLILIGALIFLFNILFITLNIAFVYQLKRIRRLISPSIYGIHTMLYRTIIVQTSNLIFFVVIPAYTFGAVYLFQISFGGKIANFCLAFTSLHLIADTLALMKFIRPYRRFVLKLLAKK